MLLTPAYKRESRKRHLLSLCVALKDEGAKRGLAPFVVIPAAAAAAAAPVAAFHHQSHQPAVLLVGRKLTHLAQPELERTHA